MLCVCVCLVLVILIIFKLLSSLLSDINEIVVVLENVVNVVFKFVDEFLRLIVDVGLLINIFLFCVIVV